MAVILTTIIELNKRQKRESRHRGECRWTVVTFRIAKIVFVTGAHLLDSNLEEAKSDIREDGCKRRLASGILKKTHRYSHHNKSNENRIVTVN